MNVNSLIDSNKLSSCEVTSKYFSTRGAMDESLSEFQEKKNFAQKTQKPSTSKPKPRKNLKRIKGQKDIRTVLKKNDLVAYSNDFDKICKQSGIDVDSEQLQLAIALSKSLQNSESRDDDSASSSGSLTTQERNGKIRTTLQEYGFVVPDIKITTAKSRKTKKYRKPYKLLTTTEAEKQQIISDRYSQVLFQHLEDSGIRNKSCNLVNPPNTLYFKGTNISYEEVKDNNKFYVDKLLEKAPCTAGSLLKNWAEIPGRALSPVFEETQIRFEKIVCQQEELDILLSGVLKSAQEIIRNKYSLLPLEEPSGTDFKSEYSVGNSTEIDKMDTDCIVVEDLEINNSKLTTGEVKHKNSETEVMVVDQSNLLTVTQNIRSYSPDIFDEEVSELLDNSNHSTDVLNQEQHAKSIAKSSLQVMDLTESVNTNSQSIQKPISQLSQGKNVTKRKTNDFMDITECVVGSSQPIREKNIEDNIDLTQNSDSEDDKTIIIEKASSLSKNIDLQSMDLTRSSDTNEDLPDVQISGKPSMDDTIILNESYSTRFQNKDKSCIDKNNELVDYDNNISLTKENLDNENEYPPIIEIPSPQNSVTSDKVPVIIDSKDDVDSHTSIINTIFEGRPISPIEFIGSCNDILEFNDASPEINATSTNALYLTEDNFKSPKQSAQNSKSKTDSFFEEFVHAHSESSKENTDESFVHKASLDSTIVKEDSSKSENEDIDLTQETDSSEDATNEKVDSPKISNNAYSLGKIGDVSIDYDDVFDDIIRSHASSVSQSQSISSRSLTADGNGGYLEKLNKSDLVSNSSQNSDVFEISDKELDYSLHKSRVEFEYPMGNFEFGGISVVDNLPDLPSFRPSTDFDSRSLNRSVSDSCLPTVEIKETKSCNSETLSPSKTSKNVVAKTPKNAEYIIKIDEVTPMLDYERMTTPERNAELDKYGLKPFKRKRAIQFLTHLYNQTHPIVESLEDLPSPSKRFKPTTSNTSPTKTKSKSPKKLTKLFQTQKNPKPSKKEECEGEFIALEAIDKENDIYDATNENPDIRQIDCCEEDWVFQKREKAKMHSCRVPLHVAFHNYVSSRPRLRDAILRYEPVNIDVIHKGLSSSGHKYDPKDLLKFMDKKCITVKTADNNSRNKKHY